MRTAKMMKGVGLAIWGIAGILAGMVLFSEAQLVEGAGFWSSRYIVTFFIGGVGFVLGLGLRMLANVAQILFDMRTASDMRLQGIVNACGRMVEQIEALNGHVAHQNREFFHAEGSVKDLVANVGRVPQLDSISVTLEARLDRLQDCLEGLANDLKEVKGFYSEVKRDLLV